MKETTQNNKTTPFKKLIFNHLNKMKLNLVISALCMLGFTVTQLMSPWPLKLVFDYILLDKPIPSSLSFMSDMLQSDKMLSLLILSSTIILIASFKGLFSYFQIFMTSRIGFQLVYTLRRELFAHLQRLSLSFHNRARTGELMTKVTSDTKALKDLFSETILNLTTHLLTILGMFAIMFTLNWKLSLIVLATFPAFFYALYYLFKKIKVSAKKQRKQEGKIASRISEIMSSVLLVQAFGRENYEDELFERDSTESLEESIRTVRMTAAATRTVEIISALGKWAVIFVGSLQVLNNKMTPGDVLIFASYTSKMYRPIQKLVKLSTRFTKAIVSIERLSEILNVESQIQIYPHAKKAINLKGDIIFENTSFVYDNGKNVLKSVSFAISSGQRVALVGASGAGKSTIARLILRLHEIQNGKILIDGVDIKHYQLESLRSEIGIVLQDSILLGTTIKENISYGKQDATRDEIEEAARQAHVHEFIMTLPDGYDTLLGERGSTLSGGQRQRIGLARAIIKHPSILILDEPTSAVDAESEQLIHDAIQRLQKGKTTIVIAHKFSFIKKVDLILVLKDGKIIEQGKHDQLLNLKGYYYELFSLQNHEMGMPTGGQLQSS